MFLALLSAFMLGISVTDGILSYPRYPRVIKVGEFPSNAYVTSRGTRLLNSGSVLSRYYVLSVCKRLAYFNEPLVTPPEHLYSNIRVVVGTIASNDSFAYQGTQVRWIYYWEDHPKCRCGGETAYWTYDFSVIKVTMQFILNELVTTIPFNRDQRGMTQAVEDIISNKRVCYFVGSGAINVTLKETEFEGNITVSIDKEDYSTTFRTIEMQLLSNKECIETSLKEECKDTFIYRKYPSEDTLCAIGLGEDGDGHVVNRTGFPAQRDFGGQLLCKTSDGGMLAVGHFSHFGTFHLASANCPSTFARFDWGAHPWLNQFYSPSMFEKHWVDPVYPKSKDYCKSYKYAGPIPPDL